MARAAKATAQARQAVTKAESAKPGKRSGPSGAAQASNPAPRRRPVTVALGGKEYRVVTDADEAWLQDVATRVDEAMSLVRDRTETVDTLDIAMLTALNLARELVSLRDGGVRPVARASDAEWVDRKRLDALIELAESALP
jgi:cell division protein ZapA (FtsZ GTPase activity inhibitor)